MIKGSTRLLGVIGYPIEHSLSPTMQNAAIESLSLDYAYVPLKVAPEALAVAVTGLRALGFHGFNVTVPHKENIMPLLDEISMEARIIGAVNTVHNDNGVLKGYNTDYLGFIAGLRQNNIALSGKNATIIGAGGASKAIIYALISEGVRDIYIGVRNTSKADTLIASLEKHMEKASVTSYKLGDIDLSERLKESDILVQTTPLGMHPNSDAMPPVDITKLKKACIVYDLIYNPAETTLLREAKALGHKVINGELMLVAQGSEALRIWTGVEPDQELMREILRGELKSK